MIHFETSPNASGGLSPEDLDWLNQTSRALLRVAGASPRASANVLLTGDDEIRRYNAQWRGEDSATDVLSFPSAHGVGPRLAPLELGDIIISVERAAHLVATREHRDRLNEEVPLSCPWDLKEEVLFLVIHGALHLLDYDHATPDEEAEMRRLERSIFAELHPNA